MKFGNAQEFFQYFQRNWPRDGAYYIWGAKNTAMRLTSLFKNDLNIIGFIDSDEKKWGTTFLDHPVFRPDDVLSRQERVKIIVASLAYSEIRLDLKRRGLAENIDFLNYRIFLNIYKWQYEKKVFLYRTDLSITSYCNLRCRHCNMLMPYYNRHRHYETSKILLDVETYFRWVDYVEQFNILGGETFLHPELYKITEEIAKHYRGKIEELAFFSNGTIIPDERMLSLMREYQIKVYIGDYRNGLPALRPKVDAFIHTLENHHIAYESSPSEIWVDFNHTPTDRTDWDDEKMMMVCEECGETFRGLHDQKFYFCHLSASAALSGRYEEEPGDYFDLTGPADERRGELVAFNLGSLPKGYVSYCRRCGGCSPANQQVVPIAEQLPPGHTKEI